MGPGSTYKWDYKSYKKGCLHPRPCIRPFTGVITITYMTEIVLLFIDHIVSVMLGIHQIDKL